ncbi:hypothetical protein Slin15195_G088840 [Septoria linicola]|uniref:Uncharacterized protein n=1 Tax=Septoria linicola TaxID=215465 RepID=A0A9Q9AUV4_9PEZI|nr:hypothetical protein Slin15195_G088840 [Septoria linicola]
MGSLHLSIGLLIATSSLAASITFLITHPERQEYILRRFIVAWVAIAGAIFWLMASALLVSLFRRRGRAKSEALEPGRRTDPGGIKYFRNGTRAPTISRPIPRTLTCNALPSSSMPSTTSTMPSPPDSPSLKPPGSSRCNMLMSPELPPQLPSIFSPFQFHPPDDKILYPQHQAPPRSDSLAALVSPSEPTTTTTSKSTFDEIMPESSPRHIPSRPQSERCSLASTVSDVSSSALLERCISRVTLAPPQEAHVSSHKSSTTETTGPGWPPGESIEEFHRQTMAKAGKSLPHLPQENGTWYRCHLKEGGGGHRLSTSSILGT